MARFEVYANGVQVGFSELEAGDPSMGVAGGRFLPTPTYSGVQAAVVAARDSSQEHLAFGIRLNGGEEIPAQGGVRITDYSAELGTEGLLVEVLGIAYPLYAELFPDHVAAYQTQSPKKDREKQSL